MRKKKGKRNCLESEREEGLLRAALIGGDNSGKWMAKTALIGEDSTNPFPFV